VHSIKQSNFTGLNMHYYILIFCFIFSTVLAASETNVLDKVAEPTNPLEHFNIEKQVEDYQGITSLLVWRNGEMLFEQYYEGTSKETLHNTRSLTKTLVAMLLGIAIDNGHLKSERSTIFDEFKDKIDLNKIDKRKRTITYEDMLTMSSMLECDDQNMFSRGHEERMYIIEDWAKFTLKLPVRGFPNWVSKPEDSPYGRAFSYCTAQSVLLGIAIERLTSRSLDSFAEEMLLRPLGINNVEWQYTPTGEVSMAGGTGFASRSLLRLGRLLLNEGTYEEQQVISKDWVEKMLTVHAQPRDRHGYGYQIWQMPYTYMGEEIRAWSMSGNGGNYVIVIPQLALVSVITSTNYNTRYGHSRSQKLFQEIVLASLE